MKLDQWETIQHSGENPPTTRMLQASTTVDSFQSYYLFGGLHFSRNPGTRPRVLDDMWRFSALTSSWDRIGPSGGAAWPPRRLGGALIADAANPLRMYLHGGSNCDASMRWAQEEKGRALGGRGSKSAPEVGSASDQGECDERLLYGFHPFRFAPM